MKRPFASSPTKDRIGFFDAPGKHRRQVGEASIFVPSGGTRHGIINVCYEILDKFGYPKE